ncbi:alpha/beta-hydrolase [Cucurbitaria berberidis CBS 394.84]|uniref:Alpha/beta-hydrolase n=1 Tax=Cucurbitaria berberidis CBS 394.84 TaxID=1168544 RepID=A0A9P4GE65_9PLEO|nr:alpha/beta-hydrolase [Cucurbitaria berberidis CBS 394.84]KAF1844323.1 alpha/beta-hydrolase [Cucurbitaria berberidis CBS 394.84]
MSFNSVPAGAQQQPTPFELHIDEKKLQDFKTLLKLSPVAKETYENLQDDGSHGRFGVSRKWIVDTKKYWEQKYDWRKEETHINSFPNFKTNITDDDGGVFDVHFAALFSSNPSAIPIAFFHGWPGSFLEFLPLLDILRKKYTPETLPYHIIVPSLPGFTLSSDPPLTRDWKVADTSRIMHKLLLSLGFGPTGYLVQGGDIGSLVSRVIAATYDECKGMHLNFMLIKDIETKSSPDDVISEAEKKGQERLKQFMTVGRAYADEHGTKPSTIGLVLSSSPVAQLAWIGEKFLAWSDPSTTPSLDTILADITLYWLTECFPTSIYTYREAKKLLYVDKPIGYSYFPYELAPVPKAWAEKTGKMVFFKAHEKGGHFAALERPEELFADVEAFVKVAWK